MTNRNFNIMHDRENLITNEHAKRRIERRVEARKFDVSIIIGGTIAAALVEGLNYISKLFAVSAALTGWSFKILGVTLIISVIVPVIRNWWWKGEDEIYESEK